MSFLSHLFQSFTSDENADLVLLAPISGTLVPITEVPDVVISEKVVGDGVAILPIGNKILAPCDGIITRLISTNSAFAIKSDIGVEIYVNFGVGTLDLAGDGFTSHIKLGDRVKKGDLIISVDLNEIENKIKSTITSIIAINSSANIQKVVSASGKSKHGETPCMWIHLDKEHAK